jgi:hypothetical protein
MNYDFSIENPQIKGWLNRENDLVPVREFVYLHDHPLIRPNFLSDIEVLIFVTGQHMLARGISGAAGKRLLAFSETFANRLEVFVREKSENVAKEVLESLREIYLLCEKIRKM